MLESSAPPTLLSALMRELVMFFLSAVLMFIFCTSVSHSPRNVNVEVATHPHRIIATVRNASAPITSDPVESVHSLRNSTTLWDSLRAALDWLLQLLPTSSTPAHPPPRPPPMAPPPPPPEPSPRLLLFGPNGSGKGTQGALITEHYPGITHVESGAIFRQHIANRTDLGRQAKAYMDHGELVPDALTVPMVLEALQGYRAGGWLLDGFPRNAIQAEMLWAALRADSMKLDYVIEILLPRPVARERIVGRRLCTRDPGHPNNIALPEIAPRGRRCQVCRAPLVTRADDQDLRAIDKRHDIYYDTVNGTLAAVAFYRRQAEAGALRFLQVDGAGSIEQVTRRLAESLPNW